MRIARLLSAAVLIGCIPIVSAPAQNVGVSVGLNLGPARTILSYNSDTHGDWRAHYREWQPTTVYEVNGQYYDKKARGARAVMVYRRNGQYFFPPQDKKWVGVDKRYNYKRRPNDDDYRRHG